MPHDQAVWWVHLRVAPEVALTDEERAELNTLVRRRHTNAWLSQRAPIVLLAADGMQNKDIAVRLGVWPDPSGALA